MNRSNPGIWADTAGHHLISTTVNRFKTAREKSIQLSNLMEPSAGMNRRPADAKQPPTGALLNLSSM
jgi:hypothetical protein